MSAKKSPPLSTSNAQHPVEHLMSSRTLQWTAMKTPATSVGRAMNSVESTGLTQGIRVKKITSRGKIINRVVTVSKDNLALFCTHQKIKKGNSGVVTGAVSTMAKKLPLPAITRKGIWGITGDLRDRFVRYIDVADIDFVCTGAVITRRLENARSKSRLKGHASKIDVMKQEIVIIGHHGDQTMDILVASEKERIRFIDCVKQMIATFQEARANASNEALLLRYIWYDVDTNRDGLINEKEFIKILDRINFTVKNPDRLFQEFCKTRNLNPNGISLSNILALLTALKSKQASGSMANLIWRDLFGEHLDRVNAKTFLDRFIHAVQGEKSKTLADIKELFVTMNSIEIDHKEGEPDGIVIDEHLSRARFEVYLYHGLNDAYDPECLNRHIALDQPMSQYYINTSHNTYLTGDQLQSSSSVEMYTRALQRGCKCIELDCWDGDKSKKSGLTLFHPVVFHGHTLTSKILFEDVLQAVKCYIDDNPDTYPIILSLESHCSHDFQRAMAKYLEETFGDDLYVPKGTPSGDLPSPESLRGKVVIKGKRPPDPDDSANVELLSENNDDDYDQYEATGSVEPSPQNKPKNKGDLKTTPAKPPKIVPELARLTLFHGTKLKTFEQSISEPQSHMHSIGESKIAKIIAKDPKNAGLWRQYNVHHMTRTYPAGSRVDSSNYNPIQAWSVGCQLVALNFQTPDSPLLLNDGLFRLHNGCGYLPKPFSATSDQPIPQIPQLRLRVRVLSGSCLPKPKGAKSGESIDPYVQITIHDVDASFSYVNSTHITATANNNGFCPVWNESQGQQFNIFNPDIAMIEFNIGESDVGIDDRVGCATIPVNCLRTGYRSIQLYDKNNTRTGPFQYASLLVEIQKEQMA